MDIVIDKRAIVYRDAIIDVILKRGSLCARNSENVMIRMAVFCNLEILSETEMSLDVQT